ncbi:hypothetical protein [Novipirellula caenicola]
MNCRMLGSSVLLVLFAVLQPVVPLWAQSPAEIPQAAAMFERLIEQLPADVEPIDIHKYVGKPFVYTLHASNSREQETALVGFVVSGRLYVVHCLRTEKPVVTVYHCSTLIADYVPVTKDGDESSRIPVRSTGIDSFETELSDKRTEIAGLAQAADVFAVIDGRAKNRKLPFEFSTMYSTSPDAPRDGTTKP